MCRVHSQLIFIVFCVIPGFVTANAAAQEAGFKPVFNGRTLDGWQASEMSYWSVEDGTITGCSTEQNPCKSNQFLVWQLGDVDDFELKLKYRISGTPAANSGIQIRSRIDEGGHAAGYQADIDLAGRFAGALYDERGRGMLANRGQKTSIGSDGKKNQSPLGDSDALKNNVKKNDWNNYHIIARGNHIILKVNDQITAEVTDNDKAQREMSGALALQLHAGPPMTIQFKDIQIRPLK